MTKKGTIAVAFAVTASALIYLLRDSTWPCGVMLVQRGDGTIRKDGRSTTYGPISGSRISYGTPLVSQGTQIGDEHSPAAVIETARFGGNGDLKFHYEGEVTRIYLWSGKSFVYGGPPIPNYHLTNREIGFHFEWNGKEASVEIQDSCSLSSLWRSFI